MSALTSLTLKAALDGLKAKTFSAVEITQAHVEAVELLPQRHHARAARPQSRTRHAGLLG